MMEPEPPEPEKPPEEPPVQETYQEPEEEDEETSSRRIEEFNLFFSQLSPGTLTLGLTRTLKTA